MKVVQETFSAATSNTDLRSFFEALKKEYEITDSVDEMLQKSELIKHFPKPKNKKSTPPPEERRGIIEEHKCGARVWKEKPRSGGLGYDNIQCSSKKVDGCDGLCKKHFKLFNENKLWLGKITEERPKEPVHPTAGPKMWSTDEDGNDIVKEKKRKSPPKEKKERKPRKKKEAVKGPGDMSIDELKALIAKRACEEEALKNEDVSGDGGEVETIVVDGTEYQHDKETHVLTRVSDFEEVGKWNVETGKIDFKDNDE